jgi:hypothetical protein
MWAEFQGNDFYVQVLHMEQLQRSEYTPVA